MFFRFELNVLRALLNFDRNYDVLQDKSLDIPFKRILSMANDCSCAMVYLHRLFVLKTRSFRHNVLLQCDIFAHFFLFAFLVRRLPFCTATSKLKICWWTQTGQ